MVWFKRRNKQSVPRLSDDDSRFIDTDQDVIPLEDPTDATSLMFMLGMEHGGVFVTRSPEGSLVKVGDQTFTGATDLEALREAWVVMSHAKE